MNERALDLDEDPRRLQVTMMHEGRALLGDVVGSVAGRLQVRHFNGEPWPIEPETTAVRALVCTWDEPS